MVHRVQRHGFQVVKCQLLLLGAPSFSLKLLAEAQKRVLELEAQHEVVLRESVDFEVEVADLEKEAVLEIDSEGVEDEGVFSEA